MLKRACEARRIDVSEPLHESRLAVGARGVWHGRRVYVKALAPDSDERRAAELLRKWRDGPVAQVLDADQAIQVFEELHPGETLESHYDALGDDDSLLVLANVAMALAHLEARDIAVPTARERGAALVERRRPDCIEPRLWSLARARYLALLDSQGATCVAHGDLHHGNVLLDRARGWIAIDPKGVTAELEFELACALRNPIARHPEWADAGRMSRRAALLAQRTAVNRDRLLGWAFAQSILAAAWGIEDGLDPLPWLTAGRVFLAALPVG
jgi:streptomycin 6-kinase